MDIEAIAQELLEAFDRGLTLESVAARNPGFGFEAAYRVAAAITRLRRARGETTVGRKIGFTNRNIWPEYGMSAPIWAPVYDRTLIRADEGRAKVSLRGTTRPRLEPELAFRLKRPLEAVTSEPSRILEHVEWVAASFEIVDCHFADWKFQPVDCVADSGFHHALVLGTPHPVRPEEIDALVQQLQEVRVTLVCDGVEVDRGVGANALGHPASALAHLAALLAKQLGSEPLATGEVITTGTLTAAMSIRAGERWTSQFDGLGVSGLSLELVS